MAEIKSTVLGTTNLAASVRQQNEVQVTSAQTIFQVPIEGGSFNSPTLSGQSRADGILISGTKADGTNALKVVGTSLFSGNVESSGIITGNGSGLTNLPATSLTGTIADARIASPSVTQHQGSLSIGATQLTGTIADARIASSSVTQHQGSITSLGTLSSATISGDLTVDTDTFKVNSTDNKVGIKTSSNQSDADFQIDGHTQIRITPANKRASTYSFKVLNTDKTASSSEFQGPVVVTHDLFKHSGKTNGFADDSNHFHDITRINRITNQGTGDVLNLERVQEQYYAIQSNLLKSSKAAFWNWHRVTRSIANSTVTQSISWDVSLIQDSSNRAATSQVPFSSSELTTFTMSESDLTASGLVNGSVLQVTVDIDFVGAIVAATLYGKCSNKTATTIDVTLYNGNYKSTDEVADGNSQTALTAGFSVKKIDTTQALALGSDPVVEVQNDTTRAISADSFKVHFGADHNLQLNDVITIITDGSGGFQEAEAAFVIKVDNALSATFAYGRMFDSSPRRTLTGNLNAVNVVGVLKGSLDGLHRFTQGDALFNFWADNNGRYKSYSIGPGVEVENDCIAIGKNVYNKDASTIKIGYDNNMLNIDSAGIDVEGTINSTTLTTSGNITTPRLVTNEIQCVGELHSGTAQPITYDAKEHRFRDYDEVPNNLMVIKKTDGVPIGKVGINHNNPVSALHIVGGHTSGGGISNEALRVIGSGLFTSKDEISLVVARDTDNNATTNGGHVLKIKQDVSTSNNAAMEEMNIGFVGSGGGGIYNNSTPLASYIQVANNRRFEIASGTNRLLSLDGDASFARFGGGATFGGDITITDRITHSGDSNTAIRFPADNTITFETASSERLRVDSAGRVGIGTNSPTEALDVSGNILSNGVIKAINSSSNAAQLEVGRNGNEYIEIKVEDLNNRITAYQDTDGNQEHNFIIDRQFLGSGANNLKIQKDGTDQVVVDTSGNLSTSGTIQSTSYEAGDFPTSSTVRTTAAFKEDGTMVQDMKVIVKKVTGAEAKAMDFNTTSSWITLIPTPGANKVIVVRELELFIDRGSWSPLSGGQVRGYGGNLQVVIETPAATVSGYGTTNYSYNTFATIAKKYLNHTINNVFVAAGAVDALIVRDAPATQTRAYPDKPLLLRPQNAVTTSSLATHGQTPDDDYYFRITYKIVDLSSDFAVTTT